MEADQITYIILISTALIAVAIGRLVIPTIVRQSRELHLYDLPDTRKVHKLPIPRLGGVSFMPAVIVAMAVVFVCAMRLECPMGALNECDAQHFSAYLAGVTMLYFAGLYDDIHGISYKIKFVVQIISAALLCVAGLWIADFEHVFYIDKVPFWIGMPLSVLFVVYLTNALNLIDGIDGLASGISCMAFFVIAALSIVRGELLWAMISVAYIGVLLVFFYYNVFGTRLKIFMGDAGSLTIGFTLSAAVLHFWRVNPVWDPDVHNLGIIVMSPLVIPMLDVVRVFSARIKDKRNPFLPDKNHIHHKLMRAGLKGKLTMVALLLLTAVIVLGNYLIAKHISQTLMVAADIAFFITMHLVINLFIYRRGVDPDEHTQSPV